MEIIKEKRKKTNIQSVIEKLVCVYACGQWLWPLFWRYMNHVFLVYFMCTMCVHCHVRYHEKQWIEITTFQPTKLMNNVTNNDLNNDKNFLDLGTL